MEKAYWLAFSLIGCRSRLIFGKLLESCGSLESAWKASATELRAGGMRAETIQRWEDSRAVIDPEKSFGELDRDGIRLITFLDPEYPALLAEIHQPPAMLFVKGRLSATPALRLAVVGTRKTSAYGRRATAELLRALPQASCVIVSGLAHGIDAVAHQTALDRGLTTWAVLGCGLDLGYPAANQGLAARIVATGGAILSEYPPGTPPLKEHFPARNRIISGLSQATLVVEAPDRSGALITASFALEQNRDVFAVPGEIFSLNARGTNRLITQGARPIVSADDLREALGLAEGQDILEALPPLDPDSTEAKICAILSTGAVSVDQIAEKCKLGVSVVSASLTHLEILGRIERIGPQTYTLASRSLYGQEKAARHR